MQSIIIGKRITFGAAVGGLMASFAWYWNLTHPEAEIPSHVLTGLTTAVTAIGQVFIVNRFGVTQKGGQ